MTIVPLGKQSSWEEMVAQVCENHAQRTPYVGPPYSGGDMYCGWPLPALVDAVVPNASRIEKLQVITEIKKRNAHLMPLPAGLSAPATPPSYPSNREMLAMRMRWHPHQFGQGFEHVDVHQASDKVFVWVITKDLQTATMEDEAAMFPSDTLVAKLNMLKKE